MSEKKQFLSLEEVADLLGVHYQLIYRLVRSGELPAVRLGRIYRIERADLDRYLERSKTSSGPAGGTCASCHTTYGSDHTLRFQCRECGAPICQDCWLRRDIRLCAEHRPATRE